MDKYTPMDRSWEAAQHIRATDEGVARMSLCRAELTELNVHRVERDRIIGP